VVQLLAYVDDVNILGGIARTIEINTAASAVTSLVVNSEKTKYVVISRDQNAGRNQNMTDNSSFENVEYFKYLGKNANASKFDSRRNSEQTEVRECFRSFGAEFFVFQFFYPKM
jgi:hypothetical protein